MLYYNKMNYKLIEEMASKTNSLSELIVFEHELIDHKALDGKSMCIILKHWSRFQ